MILPLPTTNQTLVFAADRETMARVMYWARELDTPSTLGDASTTFVYDVRNTSAGVLAQIIINAGASAQQGGGGGRGGGANQAINQALGLPGGGFQQGGRGGGPQQQLQQGGRGGGQNQGGRGGGQNQGAGRGGAGRAGQAVAGAAPGGGAIAVDDGGNRILFTGTASQFATLRTLLQRLDEPAKEVVVEVTVAEVTLTDETRSGVEFFIDALNGSGERYSGGTMGAPVGVPGSLRTPGPSTLGRGGSGLNLFFDRPNDYNIALNAIASNSKVNILSRPRLVARSGAAAYIQVGADVPLVIGQAAVNTGTDNDGALNVQQQIQYRQTGVLLNITPVIYGEDRVDIIVSQEVSAARDNPNPAIQSPIIDNRTVSTTLSLGDGQMAVLGGLVEDSFTKTNSGIPFLKDIPILGFPFRVDTVLGRKTELVVLITPFIIRNDDDMSNIAEQMSREVDAKFAVGRGGSYTLTPYGAGISIGLNPPSPTVSGTGLRRPSETPAAPNP
jgi:general secretion pathway protein D